MTAGDISSYFELEPAPETASRLETPVPVVDLDKVDRNLRLWQQRCDRIGLANRPHVKTHKMTSLAQYQLALGASGITVQKLGEAEVMAQAGINDILLTYNVVGEAKVMRLAALARAIEISVVADNPTTLACLERAAKEAGSPIKTLVECDTGGGRNGVQSPKEAAALARRIADSPTLKFKGLMTFPKPGERQRMGAFLEEAVRLVGESGMPCECITVGGTPDIWKDDGLDCVSEYRAGTYIFNDQSMITAGACSEDDCAVDVIATIVSMPTSGRAVVDAGSKSLTSDQLGEPGFGRIRGTDARLYSLTEEHGMIDRTKLGETVKIGDTVRIIPNHVCPVINLFDRVAVSSGGRILGYARVDARGKVA